MIARTLGYAISEADVYRFPAMWHRLLLVRDAHESTLILVPEGQHVPSSAGLTILPLRSYADRESALRDASELEEALGELVGVTCVAR